MKDVQFGVFPDLKCEAEVNAVCMSKTGSLLACGTDSGKVQIWDYLTCVRKAVIDAHEKKVTGVCFSNDEKYVFSSSCDKTLKQWSVLDQSLVKTFIGH